MPEIGEVSEIGEGKKKHEYPILKQSKKPEWTSEWNLSEYVSLTDALIGKLDGSIPLKDETAYHNGEVVKEDLDPPTDVIYLDKSARPIAWLVRSFWAQLAERRNGELPKRPNTFFLNIDKEDWLKSMGVPAKDIQDPSLDSINYSKIDPEHYARIRALFSKEGMKEVDVMKAWDYPTWFDNRHVMIIDEVKSSGTTLDIARNLLSRAFPDTIISGQYWAKPARVLLNGGAPDKKGRQQFKVDWMPAWYDANFERGRGVGNKDSSWPEQEQALGLPSSEATKIGRYVLSTPLRDPKTNFPSEDRKSTALINEVSDLTDDLKEKKILYRPSSERVDVKDSNSVTNFKKRIERLNGMSFDEWRVHRDLIAPKRS